MGIFDEMQVILPVLFFMVLGIIAISGARSISLWSRNNRQPLLSVPSRVIGKRALVHYHHHQPGEAVSHHHTDTQYYVTFQVESGDRIEFKVNGGEYGMLAEQDEGRLTFRGTRYLAFEREVLGSGVRNVGSLGR